jgi:hypothetical protein
LTFFTAQMTGICETMSGDGGLQRETCAVSGRFALQLPDNKGRTMAQKPFALSLSSIGLFILLKCCRAPVAQEEVKVATLIGLQDTIFEQFCIAAPRGFPLRW